MATGLLRDQLGVIAFIEELRRKQIASELPDDLKKRQEEVAQLIREYYRSQQIDVPDSTVEEGLRLYFDDQPNVEEVDEKVVPRPRYRLRIPNVLQNTKVILASIAICCIFASSYVAYLAFNEAAVRQAAVKTEEVFHLREGLRIDIQDLREKHEALVRQARNASLLAVEQMLETLVQPLQKASMFIANVAPAASPGQAYEARRQLEEWRTRLTLAEKDVAILRARMMEAGRVLSVYDKFKELTARPDYQQLRSSHSFVQNAEHKTEQTFTSQGGLAEAAAAYQNLIVAYQKAENVEGLSKELLALSQKIRAMGLSPAERMQAEMAIATAASALQMVDVSVARQWITILSGTLHVAQP